MIAFRYLMRRKDRAATPFEDAEPWDLIVLDEAHPARRRAAGSQREGGPNNLLRLMRSLKERTQGLVLLTATPMQVHPIEVWDLLDLLGLPPEWTQEAFLEFFEHVGKPDPSAEALDRMARLFQAVERFHGGTSRDTVQGLTGLSNLKAGKLLRALRDVASIPRRRLGTADRTKAVAVMRTHTPIRHLISRHTRELLRRYSEAGVLSIQIASRQVEDRFVEMSEAEQEIYEAVGEYISKTYERAAGTERSAVGFVMTVYRRRLASSFEALRRTLEKRRESALQGVVKSTIADEDVPDDEALDEQPDAEKVKALASRALAVEEVSEIERMLERIRVLPSDSKLARLTRTLDELMEDGYRQVMVFTQYTDTMDFLRKILRQKRAQRLMCFSGRGGEVPAPGGPDSWRQIDREQVKRRFRDGEADLLLCTDAAAEGLNFQFCGTLVNYDMPWNPMRVEQRIGRIDRLGQSHGVIRIVNLHYEGTVETDIYRALRHRIGLFEEVVGRLQPILARMPKEITDAVLSGEGISDARNVADRIGHRVSDKEASGFDIDATLDEEPEMPERSPSPVNLDDLDRVISNPDLMPLGTEVQPLGRFEYGLRAPGNPFFRASEDLPETDTFPIGSTLKDSLER